MKRIHLLLSVVLVLAFIFSGCQTKTPTPIPATPTPEPTEETPMPEVDTIHKIQGANHFSPMEGEMVTDVAGVVTVLRSDGFYMQSTEPDDDPYTSEGIFIETDGVPTVKVGDAVLVSGKVKEKAPGGSGTDNLTQTLIDDVTVAVVSSGNDLPAPIIVGEGGRIPPTQVIDNDSNGYVSAETPFDPDEDGLDFYESMEGMLIQINDALVVGPTNAYKEIVVVGDMGAHAGVLSELGSLVIQADDFNPERIILDDLLVELPYVDMGDYATEPIIGVVDFDYGNFKILPFESVHFTSGGLTQETATDPGDADVLRIADYNVENFSTKEPERVAKLADQIVNIMLSPDIIALQEIQDNNGAPNMDGVAADETYQAIIDAVVGLGGPAYAYINIDPKAGNDGGISGGNIRNGYLYRLDSGLTLVNAPHGDAVTPVEILVQNEKPMLSLNPGRIDPENRAFDQSRKPIVVQFLYKGESLFLINNHFNSKGGDMPLFGKVQPPKLESEAPRVQQAQVVFDFVAALLAVDPTARVVVMGDLNDFQFSPPLEVLKTDGLLTDLVETLPVEERYTYVYDGNGQVLDHILVSEALLNAVSEFNILHINSGYDIEQRFSDHEISLATFTIE
ncbi:MAG: endonuclease/exonuclease/phosphatase family protein [Anaerolineaceae bacterium]|nr:endonuclease/exonuclease/phosphatase family protein [Anaerolineaceae bacterium]